MEAAIHYSKNSGLETRKRIRIIARDFFYGLVRHLNNFVDSAYTSFCSWDSKKDRVASLLWTMDTRASLANSSRPYRFLILAAVGAVIQDRGPFVRAMTGFTIPDIERPPQKPRASGRRWKERVDLNRVLSAFVRTRQKEIRLTNNVLYVAARMSEIAEFRCLLS